MARLISFLCQYQDPEYLDAALNSFKWLPEKLYIIEGAWKSSQGYGDTPLRSSSEVYNVIDRHVDNKKVFLIQANEAGEKEQRQVGLEKAKEAGADWCWMLDSDEIYTKTTMQAIWSMMQAAAPTTFGYRVRSYNFINSFKRWYDGNYNRIYRITPDARFVLNNDVAWEDPKAQIVTLPQAQPWRMYHYNYVKRDPTQFFRKMHYHETEDSTFRHRVTPEYGAQGSIYTIPQNIPIFTFLGRHPSIMKDHPNIRDNIYNDSDLQFSA